MQIFLNNWAATLAAPADPADQQLMLSASLPELAEGDFYLLTLAEGFGTIEDNWEIVRVTATGGATVTAERGQEGTEARQWDMSTPISLRLTAEAMNTLQQQVTDLLARVTALEGGAVADGQLVDADGNSLIDEQGNHLIYGE